MELFDLQFGKKLLPTSVKGVPNFGWRQDSCYNQYTSNHINSHMYAIGYDYEWTSFHKKCGKRNKKVTIHRLHLVFKVMIYFSRFF